MPERAAVGTRFSLLGQIEVRLNDQLIEVGHSRRRTVLVALLVDANRPVSTDRLIDRVWGEHPPQRALGTLYGYVSRLRKALRAATDVDIRHDTDGYVLAVDDESIDMRRFEHLLAAVAAMRDDERALALCGQALALWRGEALPGLDAPWATTIRENLHRQRRTVELQRHDLALRFGRHNEILPELAAATTAHPLDERLAGQYLLALHRGGRQAEALQHYHQFRQRLAREFGVDPGAALQERFQRILIADPSLEPVLSPLDEVHHGGQPQDQVAEQVAANPPHVAVSRSSTHEHPSSVVSASLSSASPPSPQIGWCTLPRDSATFLGRQREIGLVAEAGSAAGSAVAVYAIDGMPGVGKTALAVRIGHQMAGRFPDGQLFVDLHAHTAGQEPVTPMEALAALLAADGVATQNLPPGLDERAALWRARMAGRRTLLVLDNALETDQVRHLLPGSAGSLVLVTSRRRLADLDATPIQLDTLPAADAAEMFSRLAPRGRNEPDAVARLVDLCGHLPLAISLLASVFIKHSSWRVDQLIDETRTRMISVRAEMRTVAAAFDLSYQHLPARLRRFFRRLGAYPGIDIAPNTAAALDDTTVDQATEQLDALCHDHLLTESSYRRFQMHDMIREYAHTLADGDADREAALDRVYGYLARVATRADRRVSRYPRPTVRLTGSTGCAPLSSDPALATTREALAWLRTERASLLTLLRHATRHAQSERVIPLAIGLASVLRIDGPWRTAQFVSSAAVVAARRLDEPQALANALLDRGVAEQLLDDYPASTKSLKEALTHYRRIGDQLGETNACLHLGEVADLTADHSLALELLEQACSRYRNLGDGLGVAAALSTLGGLRNTLGDYARAADALKRALRGYRELGNQLGETAALVNLGPVLEQAGDLPGAAAALHRALAITQRTGSRLGEAAVLHNLGPILQRQGDLAGAAAALSRCVQMHREIGDDHGQGNALNYLASVQCDMGNLAAARELLDTSLPMLRRIGDRIGEAEALNQLGTLHRLTGHPQTGAEFHQQALLIVGRTHSRWYEAHSLAGLGRCALAAGDSATAADLLGRALATFQSIGAGEADAISTELAAMRGPTGPLPLPQNCQSAELDGLQPSEPGRSTSGTSR
ncbi:BTAD domain-containing putative transcriptional regulator [Asanoa sp. NPDC049573]|uniref:AfsR/SARP family transcriptional regulator n=1 Tax=Asanoa sp. NPDC049573 TaxID=3155396 RepID=UPI003428E599